MTKEVQKQTENKHTESTNNKKEDVEIKGWNIFMKILCIFI